MNLTDDQREEYEERAAIMQYEGGLSRERAEFEAMELILKKEREIGYSKD